MPHRGDYVYRISVPDAQIRSNPELEKWSRSVYIGQAVAPLRGLSHLGASKNVGVASMVDACKMRQVLPAVEYCRLPDADLGDLSIMETALIFTMSADARFDSLNRNSGMAVTWPVNVEYDGIVDLQGLRDRKAEANSVHMCFVLSGGALRGVHASTVSKSGVYACHSKRYSQWTTQLKRLPSTDVWCFETPRMNSAANAVTLTKLLKKEFGLRAASLWKSVGLLSRPPGRTELLDLVVKVSAIDFAVRSGLSLAMDPEQMWERASKFWRSQSPWFADVNQPGIAGGSLGQLWESLKGERSIRCRLVATTGDTQSRTVVGVWSDCELSYCNSQKKFFLVGNKAGQVGLLGSVDIPATNSQSGAVVTSFDALKVWHPVLTTRAPVSARVEEWVDAERTAALALKCGSDVEKKKAWTSTRSVAVAARLLEQAGLVGSDGCPVFPKLKRTVLEDDGCRTWFLTHGRGVNLSTLASIPALGGIIDEINCREVKQKHCACVLCN